MRVTHIVAAVVVEVDCIGLAGVVASTATRPDAHTARCACRLHDVAVALVRVSHVITAMVVDHGR